MFKNQLAIRENYFKTNGGEYEIESCYAAYEAYIEIAKDKEGNAIKNRDGSERYFAIDDLSVITLKEDIVVKKIKDDLFKVVYSVNDELVERVERDGKHFYFPVGNEKITTLAKETVVTKRGDFYHIPSIKGLVIVDEKIIESPKVVSVRKFKTDDHKAEAEKIVKNFHSHKKEEK